MFTYMIKSSCSPKTATVQAALIQVHALRHLPLAIPTTRFLHPIPACCSKRGSNGVQLRMRCRVRSQATDSSLDFCATAGSPGNTPACTQSCHHDHPPSPDHRQAFSVPASATSTAPEPHSAIRSVWYFRPVQL